MVTGGRGIEKLLIVNRGALSVDQGLVERLRAALPDYELVEEPFDAGFVSRLNEVGATVVACGGDGTVAAVARPLAGTPHRLGIVALGTFNNFARALGLPTDLEAAIEVVKSGRPVEVKVGRVNGVVFLEAAAVGFFGDTIALGEAAKDLHFGELGERLRSAAQAQRFHFHTDGDVRVRGEAFSVVAANTPSIGALLPVGEASPEGPDLELVINPGRRLLPGNARTYRVRRLRVHTRPAVTVYADATEAGTTPAEIETIAGGLRVILPT